LGDDVPIDDGIIPRRFPAERVTDPAKLTPHIFETIDPALAGCVRPGDIVFAGRNFACGKPRVQGFIAMAALDLAVICTSMPYNMMRRAVAQAIPVLVGGPPPDSIVASGDEVEIDFATGWVRNLTRGTEVHVPAMPPILMEIVANGGAQAALRAWLASHPEQAVET
jgi:3-isopropylmalate/(R)-2-methylmalate dehydratase small subunit